MRSTVAQKLTERAHGQSSSCTRGDQLMWTTSCYMRICLQRTSVNIHLEIHASIHDHHKTNENWPYETGLLLIRGLDHLLEVCGLQMLKK